MHLRTRWTQHKEKAQKAMQMVLQLCQKTLLPICGSLAGGAAAVFAAYRRRAWLSASLSDLYPTHTEMLFHLLVVDSREPLCMKSASNPTRSQWATARWLLPTPAMTRLPLLSWPQVGPTSSRQLVVSKSSAACPHLVPPTWLAGQWASH